MALGRRRTGDDEDAQIDLTPMLDVVFIMLIFFIVTASFVQEAGIDLQRPPVSDQPPPDSAQANIVLRVTQDNQIYLEGRRIDARAIRANVERAYAENPQAKVIVQAHPRANTSVFVRIADQAREAGVYDVSLATQE